MSSADGSVIIEANINVDQAEKNLEKLKRKIEKTEQDIKTKEAAKSPHVQRMKELQREIEAAKAGLSDLEARSKGMRASEAIPLLDTQKQKVNELQAEYDEVTAKVKKYEKEISDATINLDMQKQAAGALIERINSTSDFARGMAEAQKRAADSASKWTMRLREVMRSALVFTVISQGLADMREWMGKVIRTNEDAQKSFARLKGALLTLAQPIVNVLIPALVVLSDMLTKVVMTIASVLSSLFGSTVEKSKESAEALYEETKALNATGAAAKKAAKSLASFDEINKLSGGGVSGGGASSESLVSDFGESVSGNWLKDTLGEAAGMVTAGLLLGGLALVAIGAALGNIKTVVAGLALLAVGVHVGEESGTFQSWADTLGLKDVGAFVTAGLLLGGIALVAIGAATGNILTVIAGLGIIGFTSYKASESGELKSWSDTLELNKVASFVSAALLLGGIALVAIGAATANVLMVLAGLGLLAAGVFVGTESGAIADWWETLRLPQVAGWVSTALLLGGIGLLVIGIATGNLPMLLAGLGMLGAGITFGVTSGTFATWIEKIKQGLVQGWSDIQSWWQSNVAPVLTKQYWLDKFDVLRQSVSEKIAEVEGAFGDFIGYVKTEFTKAWEAVYRTIGNIAIGAWNSVVGAFESFINFVISGLNDIISYANEVAAFLGIDFAFPYISELELGRIPMLAQGAVIPPNREFMAILGDQKHGNNIETPEALLRQIVREESGERGDKEMTVILELDREQFGRLVYKYGSAESRRVGVRMVE